MTHPWIDPLRQYLDLVEQTGLEPPAGYRELIGRYMDRHNGPGLPARYATALLDGAEGDLELLRAAALATITASSQQVAQLDNQVGVQLLDRIRGIVSPASVGMHAELANRFNAAAAEFTRLATVIDPETDAAGLVTADAKTRTAWANAGVAAATMANLISPICAAAELADHPASTPEHRIGLFLDTSTPRLNRRTCWESWDAEGLRCGRFSAIAAAGIPIVARPLKDIDREGYRRPAPMQEKLIRNGHGWQKTLVDPELESVR